MKIILKPFYIISLPAIILFSGCSGEKTPDPPMIRSKTVLDTFTALENGEHSIAMKKISRLRELDPSNVFLANLQLLERNNSVIDGAQSHIDSGDIKGALSVVSDGLLKYGRHNDLMNAQKKLQIITKIHEILDVFRSPRDSGQLSAVAAQLKKLGKIYKPVAVFIPLADEKLAEAEVMNEWEIKRAIAGLVSHINTLHKNNDSDIELMYAVMEIEDPTHPVLINYLTHLNGDKNMEFVIYPDENIFDMSEDESPEKTSDGMENNEEKKDGWWNKFSF